MKGGTPLSTSLSLASTLSRVGVSSMMLKLLFCATGASFTGVTVIVNVSLTESEPSLAVTRTTMEPTWASSGKPGELVNVREGPSKLSHAGSRPPSASVAVSVSDGPSTSAKVPTGSV